MRYFSHEPAFFSHLAKRRNLLFDRSDSSSLPTNLILEEKALGSMRQEGEIGFSNVTPVYSVNGSRFFHVTL